MYIKKYINNLFFWVVVIFMAASFFRLLFLDLIEFKLDEAIWIYEITRFFLKPYLVTGTFAPISIGLFYFPLPMYVFILFATLSRNPAVVSFVIALFNVFGIIFFYFMVKKFYGNTVAIFSSLLLSLSPWSILFSRKIWTPDLFLPFAVLFFYFLHLVILKKDKKSHFFLGLTGSLLLQIHIPGLLVVLITIGILIFIGKPYRAWNDFSKKILIGFGSGFIFAIPYLLRLLFKLGCQAKSCIKVAPVYQPFTSFDLFHFLRPFQFLTGSGFEMNLGKSYADFLISFPFIRFINFLFILEWFLPLIGLYYCIFVKKELRFLGVYIFFFPVLYFIVKTPAYMYYYIVLSPVIAILAGMAVGYLYKQVPKATSYFVIGVFIVVLVLHIIFESMFNSFLGKQKIINGDYGPIFSLTKAFVEKETIQYKDQTIYDDVKTYAYLYPQPQLIHGKLGEYFAQNEEPYFAVDEYKKQLAINPKDIASLANLIYISIVTGDYNQAEQELKVLERLDASASADLKRILNQAKGTGVKK